MAPSLHAQRLKWLGYAVLSALGLLPGFATVPSAAASAEEEYDPCRRCRQTIDPQPAKSSGTMCELTTNGVLTANLTFSTTQPVSGSVSLGGNVGGGAIRCIIEYTHTEARDLFKTDKDGCMKFIKVGSVQSVHYTGGGCYELFGTPRCHDDLLKPGEPTLLPTYGPIDCPDPLTLATRISVDVELRDVDVIDIIAD